jgi:hypothetical protein
VTGAVRVNIENNTSMISLGNQGGTREAGWRNGGAKWALQKGNCRIGDTLLLGGGDTRRQPR